ARYKDSFYASRTAYILNVLMGSLEAPGGLIFQKGPGDAGGKGLNALLDTIPKPEDKRVDGCGWKHKQFEAGPGLMQLFYKALLDEDPYPVKGYIVFRHDPLLSLPDPEVQKKALDKLDLLVAIDANYSETAWYADVLLPSATYLEKSSVLCTGKGLKPSFRMREKTIDPHTNAKADWWIFKSLAERMGVGEYFKFDDVEDFWKFQLEGTGVSVEDMKKKGMVSLTDKPIWWDRMKDLKFKTPSGKIELVSSHLEACGLESFKPYKSPAKPKEGTFRLAFGRSPVHTHGRTMNNPYLHEIMPENTLWINTGEAGKLDIKNKDQVRVTAADGSHSGTIQAMVTDLIHPETVFMVHGFGRKIPWQTRGYNRGLADYRFETGLLDVYDEAGGGIALMECTVSVEPE
ncbi:MAG: molybdopterin-dependent oxidoreductase, partial [Deltaproteobacteria bacterium]|nr:molybdopterin-dependent oxidoreductase [Deltaproteobacteria bacterium]